MVNDVRFSDISLPHYNIEAEQSVLGAVMLDPSRVVDLLDELEMADFYQQRHQLIFNVIKRLYDKNTEIDIVTVTEELIVLKQLEDIGGLTYITELANAVPTSANIKHYIKIVVSYSRKRKLINVCQNIIESTHSEDDIDTIMEKAEEQIYNVATMGVTGEFQKMNHLLPEVFSRLDGLAGKKEDVTGVDTGFTDLNKITAGFQKNDLIIVAARPSVGKTAFALNVGTQAAKKGNKVAIFSLEMGADQLVTRIISAEGNIDGNNLRTGQLEDEEWKKFAHAAGVLSKLDMYFDDGISGTTVNDIRSKCRKLKQTEGLDLVIIDYLQLITTKGKGDKNRQQEVSDISRMLKGMARELGIPVIALSQLSRGVEQRQDKRPMLSDLRESGSIEQDADIVAFLYRDDYYDKESESKNMIEIIIAKHRNGSVGTVNLGFHKQYNKFVGIAHFNVGNPPT